MNQKIKLLFIPFALTLLGLILGYSFLHWLLFIKFEVFQAKKTLTNFLIPIILTGITTWIFRGKRLKILHLDDRKKDFLSYTLWIVLSVPLVISQEYMVTATGRLTKLGSISDINRLEPTKYYQLEKCYLDKKAVRINHSSAVTGKGNRDFDMYIHVAVAIFDRKGNVNYLEPVAWLGLEYKKTISNRQPERAKEQEFQKFAASCQADFEKRDLYDFVYLDRFRHSDERDGFLAAIRANSKSKPSEIILAPVDEPYEARNGKKLEWLIGSILVGSAIWLVLILVFGRINQLKARRLSTSKHSYFRLSDFTITIRFFIPQEGYYVTPLLVFTNIAIYLAMVAAGFGFVSFQTEDLMQWGANFGPLTSEGEWWRLFTSLFLHGGIVHLLANIYGLLFVGVQLEKRLGSANFFLTYLLSGLLAGIASFNFNLFTVSVGASGAIFGIYGLLIVETIRENAKHRVAILANFLAYLAMTILLGLQLNFDNAAHIGGATAGILAGLCYPKSDFRIVHGAGIVLIFALLLASPTYQVDYLKAYEKYSSIERRLAKTLQENLPTKTLYDSLQKLKDLPKEAVGDFRKLSYIPGKLREDTTVISAHLAFRSQQIAFYITGISRESYIYLDSIGMMDLKISNLPELRYNLDFETEVLPENNASEELEELEVVRQHYDSGWREVESTDYAFYRVGEKDSLGDWHGRVEDYYRSGAIQMKGRYARGLKDGVFIYYSPDSTYSSAGRYLMDDRIGKWENYHRNGRLYMESRHENGFSSIENLWDSTGVRTVIDGNGKEQYRYPNGKISFDRNIVNGLNQGFVESYYENGELKYKEYYEKGDLTKGVSFMDKTENTYDRSVNYAYPAGGFKSFYDYIDRTNKLRSDSINGLVVMRFDVHPSGEILDVRFLKRSHENLNQYAKELLLSGPKWIPARSHGLDEITSPAEVTIKF